MIIFSSVSVLPWIHEQQRAGTGSTGLHPPDGDAVLCPKMRVPSSTGGKTEIISGEALLPTWNQASAQVRHVLDVKRDDSGRYPADK